MADGGDLATKASCSHISTCALFPLLSLSLEFWKLNYCYGRFEECSRYQASQRGRVVPVNLMPSGEMLKVP